MTAASLVAFLPQLGQLDRQAITAVVGVAALVWERGHKQRRRIIWDRRATVRRVVHSAALAAIRHNPWLRGFSQRLRTAGKTPTVR